MMMFTTCSNGHDLTRDGAYIYRTGGNRECRECAFANGGARRKTVQRGSFNGSTWAEKRGEGREVRK